MGFYGNTSNAGKTQLTFDKIYPNRAQMEAQTSTDGVFIGRRVLIEYDDNTKARRRGYVETPPSNKDELYIIYLDDTYRHPMVHTPNGVQDYGLVEGDLVYVQKWDDYYYFQATRQVDESGYALFQYILRASELNTEDDAYAVSDYTLNYEKDKRYAAEAGIAFVDGWDSTIWEKGYINGAERYFQIGNLNSTLPAMTIEAEAPSIIPKAPHFAENSTNMHYTLHMTSPWGFRMKPAETETIESIGVEAPLCDVEKVSWLSEEESREYLAAGGSADDLTYYPAVFYNKKGFSPDKISHSDVETEFMIAPTGVSKKRYVTHEGEDSPTNQVDMQELKIHLPDIGNMMSDVWDVVYGDEQVNEGLVRNLNVRWGNKTGHRLIDTDTLTGTPVLNIDKASTLAGCINSAYDLMGTNITTLASPIEPDKVPNSEDTIFYGPLGPDKKIGFYYKDVEYILTSFAEKGLDQSTYTGQKEYVDLVQFEANKYYYYQNFNFYLETENYPQARTSYYLLGDPIDIEVLAWPPKDAEDKKNYPFYQDGKDYIQDVGDIPKEGVTHYFIQETQVTNVLVSEIPGQEISSTKDTYPTLIWKPTAHVGLNDVEKEALVKVSEAMEKYNKIKSYKKGFFKLVVTDEDSVLSAVNPGDTFDPNDTTTTYYYLPAYAVAVGSTSEGAEPETLFLPVDEYLTSFAQLHSTAGALEALAAYKVTFKKFSTDTYYTKEIDEENDYRIIYRLLNEQNDVDHTKLYYTLKTTYAAGEDSGEDENTEVAYYYTPYRYFIKPTGGNKNYILDSSKSKNENYTYCILTQTEKVDGKNVVRQLIVDPDTHLVDAVPVDTIFYEPDKYYYWSKSLAEDILDQSLIMKQPVADKSSVDYEITSDNKIYYLVKYAYVVKDTSGILSVGSIWNKTKTADNGNLVLVNPPDGVTLGVREEKPKWTELKGLAVRKNTLHGRLLDINLLFRFDDNIVRDNSSIAGCVHKMKDFVRMIGRLNPGEIPTIDEYGRINSTNLNGVTLTGYSSINNSSAALADSDTLLAALKKLEGQIEDLKTRVATLEGKII